MKKVYASLVFIIFYYALLGQDKAKITIEPVDGPAPWTHLELNNDSERFQFAIVTDRTGGHRPGVFMDGVNKLNLLQPEFVMSVGDLIEGYTEDLATLEREWNEFDDFVKQLEMPFFYIPGNHDITNFTMANVWEKRLGPSYYHFVYKNVLFLCLNTEDMARGAGKGTISDEQFEYASYVLNQNRDVDWTLVFMHQPLWHQSYTERWGNLEKLLSKRKHTVFTGHEHTYVKETRNNGKYFVLATTGGGSKLRGARLGEFDHVAWITMTKEGPIIANLQLEGIWDEDVVNGETKKYISKINELKPFMITPYFTDESDIKEAYMSIKITNDQDVPMNVVFDERFSWDLVGILEKKHLTINPNSVETLGMKIITRNGSTRQPLVLKADVSYMYEDQADLAIPYQWLLKPFQKKMLETASGKKKIDGLNKDWKKERFHTWKLDEKSECRFSMTYDKNYLYVAAEVSDDDIVVHGEGMPWTQDNIGIIFSPDMFAKSVMSTGGNWFAEEFIVQITPEMGDTPSIVDGTYPGGTQFKCIETDNGYFAELAVPMNFIETYQGENWETLRFNFVVDDLDTGKEINRHWWYSRWSSPDNIIGSGMFFRQLDADME